MKKKLILYTLMSICYAGDNPSEKSTGKELWEAAKNDAAATISHATQQLQNSPLYDQGIKVGGVIREFAHDHLGLTSAAVYTAARKFPIITLLCVTSFATYDIVQSLSTKGNQGTPTAP